MNFYSANGNLIKKKEFIKENYTSTLDITSFMRKNPSLTDSLTKQNYELDDKTIKIKKNLINKCMISSEVADVALGKIFFDNYHQKKKYARSHIDYCIESDHCLYTLDDKSDKKCFLDKLKIYDSYLKNSKKISEENKCKSRGFISCNSEKENNKINQEIDSKCNISYNDAKNVLDIVNKDKNRSGNKKNEYSELTKQKYRRSLHPFVYKKNPNANEAIIQNLNCIVDNMVKLNDFYINDIKNTEKEKNQIQKMLEENECKIDGYASCADKLEKEEEACKAAGYTSCDNKVKEEACKAAGYTSCDNKVKEEACKSAGFKSCAHKAEEEASGISNNLIIVIGLLVLLYFLFNKSN